MKPHQVCQELMKLEQTSFHVPRTLEIYPLLRDIVRENHSPLVTWFSCKAGWEKAPNSNPEIKVKGIFIIFLVLQSFPVNEKIFSHQEAKLTPHRKPSSKKGKKNGDFP